VLTQRQKDFVRELQQHHNGHAPYRVFEGWCEMAFCAMAKRTAATRKDADDLEARYMRLVGSLGDVSRFGDMLGMLTLDIHENGRDFLGPIAGEVSALNAGAGQFFTPFDVSYMMARMTLADCDLDKPEIRVCEPACGSQASWASRCGSTVRTCRSCAPT
jgi:type I restriction-modification system DNA methylase subunit